jgi:FkbM family methyltransferase
MTQHTKDKVWVQIGTNDGADEFLRLVKLWEPSLVILVEPNPIHNPMIWENYKDVKEVYLENVAITATPQKQVSLFVPTNNPETGLAENGLTYGHVHFSILPLKDWGKNLTELCVRGMTFAELCQRYSITDIHFLQIDTEGYDYEIIKSIDFSGVRINMVKYELWDVKDEQYEQYGEEGLHYGRRGREEAEERLKEYGYKIENYGFDNIASR